MTPEQLANLNINVRQTMIDLVAQDDFQIAKRIALLYDIDFDEWLEENSGDIVFAILSEK